MVENWVQRTAAEYAQGWNDLLPTGVAWPRDPDTNLQKIVLAMSQIWDTQVETLAATLLVTESNPQTANVLLPDWERAFGLPDLCLPTPSTSTAQRQQNLVNRMTFLGAQSRSFFIAEAATIGQTVTIEEYSPYQCGISGVGDTRNLTTDGTYRWGLGPEENRFFWTVHVGSLTASWSGGDCFCIMNRWKPAHTEVVIDYTTLQESNFTRPWNSQYLALI